MSKQCGVYEIVNTENGDRYIGSSVDLASRLRHYKNELKKQIHSNPRLQNAWNKYGIDSFEFRVVIYCDRKMTLFYEQRCLDGLNPEYNIAKDVDTPMRARIVSNETRKKLSFAGKGKRRPHSEETKRKIGAANTGNKHTLGYKHSEETKAQISATKKQNMSAETKQAISDAMKGKRFFLGKKHTPEVVEGMRKRMIGNTLMAGRCHSDETKRKMSEARKRYWAEKRANG